MNEGGTTTPTGQPQIESLLERFNTYLKENSNSLSRLKENIF